MNRNDCQSRYDHLSEKSRGYAEGVVAGFVATREAVEKITGGLITIKMPQEVQKWDDVIRDLRGSRRRALPDTIESTEPKDE